MRGHGGLRQAVGSCPNSLLEAYTGTRGLTPKTAKHTGKNFLHTKWVRKTFPFHLIYTDKIYIYAREKSYQKQWTPFPLAIILSVDIYWTFALCQAHLRKKPAAAPGPVNQRETSEKSSRGSTRTRMEPCDKSMGKQQRLSKPGGTQHPHRPP